MLLILCCSVFLSRDKTKTTYVPTWFSLEFSLQSFVNTSRLLCRIHNLDHITECPLLNIKIIIWMNADKKRRWIIAGEISTINSHIVISCRSQVYLSGIAMLPRVISPGSLQMMYHSEVLMSTFNCSRLPKPVTWNWSR